jgi:hypothetical protein
MLQTRDREAPTLKEFIRARHAFAIGAVSLVALAGTAPNALSAVQVTREQAGIEVDATDEPNLGGIVIPKSGTTVQAQTTPADCDPALNDTEKDCRIGVEVTGDDASPQPVTQVVVPSGATTQVLSEEPAPDDPAVALAPVAPSTTLAALSTPQIYHWDSRTAKICSVTCSVPHAWEIRTTADAYAASDGYAWGDRSRYGRAAEHVRCGQSGFGFSVNNMRCGFRNDPSCLRLYANNESNVSAAFKGAPIGASWYGHMHFTECGPDGVTHQRRTWFTIGKS